MEHWLVSYKYLGIWIHEKLSFNIQICNLVEKLKLKIGFYFRNKSCFTFSAKKNLWKFCDWWSVIDYGDMVHAFNLLHFKEPWFSVSCFSAFHFELACLISGKHAWWISIGECCGATFVQHTATDTRIYTVIPRYITVQLLRSRYITVHLSRSCYILDFFH